MLGAEGKAFVSGIQLRAGAETGAPCVASDAGNQMIGEREKALGAERIEFEREEPAASSEERRSATLETRAKRACDGRKRSDPAGVARKGRNLERVLAEVELGTLGASHRPHAPGDRRPGQRLLFQER
jgi:hypothetical protein